MKMHQFWFPGTEYIHLHATSPIHGHLVDSTLLVFLVSDPLNVRAATKKLPADKLKRLYWVALLH